MGIPYTSVTVSNYNLNPPPDDGSQAAANEVTWTNHTTKIGGPLKTAIEAVNTNILAAFAKMVGGAGIVEDSGGATLTASAQGQLIVQTGSGITTVTPSAVTVGSPFVFFVLNLGTGTNTLDGSGSETINNVASISIPVGYGVAVFTDGDEWYATGLTPFASDADAQGMAITTKPLVPANLAAMVATQANQETGTANDRFVVPGVQHFHPSAGKCWLKATVSGGTPTLQSSYNITGIADGGAGILDVTVATDFSSAHWACVPGVENLDDSIDQATDKFMCWIEQGSQVAGAVSIQAGTDHNEGGDTAVDPAAWHMTGHGDHA